MQTKLFLLRIVGGKLYHSKSAVTKAYLISEASTPRQQTPGPGNYEVLNFSSCLPFFTWSSQMHLMIIFIVNDNHLIHYLHVNVQRSSYEVKYKIGVVHACFATQRLRIQKSSMNKLYDIFISVRTSSTLFT